MRGHVGLQLFRGLAGTWNPPLRDELCLVPLVQGTLFMSGELVVRSLEALPVLDVKAAHDIEP